MIPKIEYAQKLVPIKYVKVAFVKDYRNMENFSFLRLANYWSAYEYLNGENIVRKALWQKLHISRISQNVIYQVAHTP